RGARGRRPVDRQSSAGRAGGTAPRRVPGLDRRPSHLREYLGRLGCARARRARQDPKPDVTGSAPPTIGGWMSNVLGLLLAVAATAQDGDEFFESKIRPVLVEQCLKCHGEKKAKGGLRL